MIFRPTAVDAYLVLGDTQDSFECELRSIALTPSADWINTLCPAGTWPDVNWSLDLTFLPGTYSADPETGEVAGTLDDFLFAHYGEQQPFAVWPYGQGQPGYSGLCSIAPAPIGGTQAEWPDESVGLPVYGQPDPIAADTSMVVAVQQARRSARRVMLSRLRSSRSVRSVVRW